MSTKQITQIGIVGGGIGAQMLCLELSKKGIRTTLIDPKIDALGNSVASEHMVASATKENLKKLSLRVDAIIFNRELDYILKEELKIPTYPPVKTMNQFVNKKSILELLEELKIPFVETYYQDNRGETFNCIDKLQLPFRFIKQYEERVEVLEIFTQDDLAEAILEMDDYVKGFMLQPIKEYTSKITCSCLMNEDGKVILYPPVEKRYENNELKSLSTQTTLSKTMLQKINRFNKKILKELNVPGFLSITYGLKTNKGIEVIEITPELTVTETVLEKAYDLSSVEQYAHLLLKEEIVEPTLITDMEARLERLVESKKPYHFSKFGDETLWITPVSE